MRDQIQEIYWMTEKEKAKLKDRLLSFAIRNGEGMYYADFFLNRFGPWKVDDDLVVTLLKQLNEDGYLEISYDYTTKDNPNDFKIIKNSEGATFLKHDGGYLKQYQDLRRKRIREFFRKDFISWAGWIVAFISLLYSVFFS